MAIAPVPVYTKFKEISQMSNSSTGKTAIYSASGTSSSIAAAFYYDMITPPKYYISNAFGASSVKKPFRPLSTMIENKIDEKITAMSREELVKAALALRGAWADREDITDDWLEKLRANTGLEERLGELYGEDLSL